MSEAILDLPAPAADARLPYGDGPFHFGDLRLPRGAGPHPVAMVIHGGFWRARYDLEHIGHVCAALTARGVATWSVEYRRLGNPGGGWPGTFLDIGAAADHLRALAPAHGLDLGRSAVVGHSAGGHLALWAAGRHRIPAGSPLSQPDPLRFGGVVALAAVSDLRAGYGMRLSQRVVAELLGGAPDEQPRRYAAASPAELLPLGVRQILLHGTKDGPVPIALSESYESAARAAGDDATLIPLPGAHHFELIDPGSREWPAVEGAVLALLG